MVVLGEQYRLLDESLSTGVIICGDNGKNVVENTLIQLNAPKGVAIYHLSNSVHEGMKEMLQTPEEITKRFKIFEED